MGNNDKFEGLYEAIGVLTETGTLFYRATVQTGATPRETAALTQAFIRAPVRGEDASASESEEEI